MTKPVEYQAFIDAVKRLGLVFAGGAGAAERRPRAVDVGRVCSAGGPLPSACSRVKGPHMASDERANILIVEDDLGLARLVAAFAQAGHAVEIVATSEEGMERVAAAT